MEPIKDKYYHWVKNEKGEEFVVENDKFREFMNAMNAKKDKVNEADETKEEDKSRRGQTGKRNIEADERKEEDKRGDSHTELQVYDPRVTLQKFANNYNRAQASVTYYKVNDVSLRNLASPLKALAILGVGVLALAYFLSFTICSY